MAAVRPSHCPCCGAPGAPEGGRLGLHGHGLRERSQLGPAAAGEPPEHATLALRRYQCQHCGAVVVAAPRGLLPRLHYRAVAVALALALWGAQGEAGHRVREQVSPLPSVGNEPMHGWRSLARWARQRQRVWPFMRGSPPGAGRGAALQAASQLAAKAPVPTGQVVADACAGALFAMPIDASPAAAAIPPSSSVAL